MTYTQLGNSGLEISRIGFGCMSLEPDPSIASSLIHRAIDLGINYFDTADMYQKGMNEEMIGNALKSRRDKVILATKVGNQWRPDGSGWDWNPSKSHILSSIEESLRRLKTDHIDLYQLHGGTIDDPIQQIIESFELLKSQGKILYYGISSIRPEVIRAYVNSSQITSVMMQYSLLDRRPEEECLELLKKNNIGVLARGSLAKGLLSGKPAESFLNYNKGQVQMASTAIAALVTGQRSAAQVAIRYALSHPAISSAIVGIRTEKQLEEIAIAMESPALSPEEIAELNRSIPINYYDSYR